ncbi:MAG: bifunctional DNA-formamidopyrimidine glycosylase/DNA-(apurinic or apyrimidinic site) lyase [Pseudomonadales bacterium]|nr:bifunctional DNA-formamidopyrimidine glycosylase/DNA-(apurinic or apyrimidinic site) lyase [Pseudomonadales bacterium]
MPELPEVETTRKGISPHIKNKRVKEVIVRQKKLRWEIPNTLSEDLPGQAFSAVDRRGKYILLQSSKGTLLIHLGMSGSLRIVEKDSVAGKHDHVDIVMEDDKALRYTDPRKFGCMLWQAEEIDSHPLLANLGPEPLTDDFDGAYLFKQSRGRSAAIKTFIMDSKVVVGVGNIYANEALFMAGINPKRAAGKISKAKYKTLVACIKEILTRAIKVGGTTLRDFTNSSGEPGYFKQALNVYGRGGEECMQCKKPLKEIRLGQRSTVYCTNCQK